MNRRRVVVLGALGSLCTSMLPARAAAVQLPPFSTATPGDALPPGWRHEVLPRVERPNRYAVVLDAGTPVLQVQSQASASSLLAELPPAAPPQRTLHWRWKVAAALAGSDITTKAGDDYAARLYVLFDLPLSRLSLGERLGLELARAVSGRDLPAAALCYVWGRAQPVGAVAPNAYTGRVQMLVVDSGDAEAGRWREVSRDLGADWQRAFGGPMPPVQAIAVSADTDNTGASATAWFGDVQLR